MAVAFVHRTHGYGVHTDFRDGVRSTLRRRHPILRQRLAAGDRAVAAEALARTGRPPSMIRRDPEHKPVSAEQLALGLPKRAWRKVTRREGSNTPLASRFAAVRVRPAHRDYNRTCPSAGEWCLIEWPNGEVEPTNLILQASRRYPPPRSRRFGQAALADRA